jgi:hypothetical protein
MAEKVNEFSYRINFIQEGNFYPIARMKFLVSKNGSEFMYDLNAENNIKIFSIPSIYSWAYSK